MTTIRNSGTDSGTTKPDAEVVRSRVQLPYYIHDPPDARPEENGPPGFLIPVVEHSNVFIGNKLDYDLICSGYGICKGFIEHVDAHTDRITPE